MRNNLLKAGFALISAWGLGLVAPAGAAVLVYEGFNYTTNGSSMNGKTASVGTGLTGNYTLDAGTGTGSVTWNSTGLSFGSNFLTASGGGLSLSAVGGANRVLGVALDGTAAATGTLWSSYLVSFSALSTNTNGQLSLRVADAVTAATNIHYRADVDAFTAVRRPGVAYDSGTTNAGSGTLATATTYLVLSKYTNVGTANGTASLWVMTQAQYDTWVAGGATEGTLATNSTWAISDTVSAGSTTLSFGSGQYLQFAINGSGSTETAVLDELRYGTALYDVVPEPSSYALLGMGVGAVWLLRRGKRRFHS